jgi:hypothetical protein
LWFAAAKVVLRLRKKASHTLAWFFLAWVFLSLIPVCLSGRFYPHYFLQLLPALCALAALTALTLPRRALLFGILIPTFLFWVLRLDYSLFLKFFPDHPFGKEEKIAMTLKSLAKPDDRIFVWGFATPIYFYSELKPTSRFLWSDWLTGRTPGPKYGRKHGGQSALYVSEKAWTLFWEDMKNKPPRFFIDTSPAQIHDYENYPISSYPSLNRFVHKKYQSVATVENAVIYELKADSK